MMKRLRFLLLMSLLGAYLNMFAQSISANNITYMVDVETHFSQGVNDYRLEKYEQAKKIFLDLINEYPTHQRITIVYLMLGKTHYQLGEYEQAISTIQRLITEYPQSNYIDDGRFVLASCYYKLEKFDPAMRELLWIADYGSDQKLKKKSRNLVIPMIEYNLTEKQISDIKAEMTGEISRAILTIKLAQKWNQMHNKDKAVSLLQNFINDNPQNEYISIMKETLKKIENQQQVVEIKVGVILPLSSEYSEQAQAILAGIKYAQLKFNQNSKYNVELVVKDSEGSIITCIKSAQELASDDQIAAIIGELESEKTASIAPTVAFNHVPLIVPVASDNGLASLSEYIFQLNGDLETRGAFLAEFAIEQLGYRKFATLSPADNYGKEMTDSFTATIDKLGGEIIAQKWYYGNTQDMARQFKSIRELGFNRMTKDFASNENVNNLASFHTMKSKDDEIPVTSIDAIFFPIYTEDIKYVVPQFAFANIKAKILGGQYWYDLDELRNKNVIAHIDSLVFESDYYIDEIDAGFHNFRTDFRKVTGRTPEAMELYGYDAMLIIADAIENDAINREAIRNHLDNLDNFNGSRGTIIFKNNNRVNSGRVLVSFRNGRLMAIK